ncbi:protoheme IX farnesyltransferase [Thermoflavifilum thermophilum]|uniref:Protoheme IX farnesyltransferase n=2 Tax=Thermoflavifilum thermophilum TaxID=1393122 RepID=A0A1I7NCU2_9BACT|nr:protoheme IX farnesyltransferase [Thermoflavifilum thermophilum]
MYREQTASLSLSEAILGKAKDYLQLTKFTLSFLVVFSCVVGYLMVPQVNMGSAKVLLLFIAGICITGAANAFNQLMERDTDALMRRTAGRPLPAGRMQPAEALTVALVLTFTGLILLSVYFNPLSAWVSLLSLCLYAFVYTPWKRWNSLAVFVGAFPGALPPLIGWIAGSGTLSAGGWSLFLLQFFWQFPHFWAIAWIAHDDYQRAGFRLLPGNGTRNAYVAMQVLSFTILLIMAGFLPYLLHVYGSFALSAGLLTGAYLLYRAWKLVEKCDAASARQLMFAAYIYFIAVQLAMLIDKI